MGASRGIDSAGRLARKWILVEHPAINSRQLTSALVQLGFKRKGGSGSHSDWIDLGPPLRTVHIVLAKKELQIPLLKAFLKEADVSLEEFMIALGGRHKKQALRERKLLERRAAAEAADPDSA